MTMRFRQLLPLCFGTVDAALTLWNIYDVRIIESAGMGWDTGAPPWPYQTPETLLFALNLPAFLIAVPIANVLRLYAPWHYLVLFPAFLLWWWLAGYAADSDLWRGERLPGRWLGIAAVCAVGFTVLGVIILRDATAWWTRYCRSLFTSQNIIMLRLSAPGVWALTVAGLAGLLVKRRSPLK